MTNQEIADFIAEKLLGWRKWELKGYPSYWEDAAGKMQITCDDYDPATDLNQAMQAAEKIGEQLHTHIVLTVFPGDYSAKLVSQTWVVFSTIGPADALARAVVKAAGGEGWELS